MRCEALPFHSPAALLSTDCRPPGEQTLGEDALEGLSLVINIFGLEQRRIMAQMHQEIQLLISVFIIAVSARTPLRITPPPLPCTEPRARSARVGCHCRRDVAALAQYP